MSLQFLVGSYTALVACVTFDPASNAFRTTTTSAVGPSPTWVEPSKNPRLAGKVFYAVNEMAGKIVSLELKDGKLEVTGMGVTKGEPAHVMALKDGSGVIATNYGGGSAIHYAVDPETGRFPSVATGALATLTPGFLASHPPLLEFKFTYSSTGPDKERQEASHPHQALEGEDGLVYVPDLGSDRIWIVKRTAQAEGIEVVGEMRLPGGAGPRHAALSPDGKHLYVLTELAHEVFIFPTPAASSLGPDATPIDPVSPEGYEIVPDEIPREARKPMNAGELLVSPLSARTLYASNRGQVDLNKEIGQDAKGDGIAVLTLSEDGTRVESHTIVRTGCNFIRGMGVTADGKWLACVGQKDGNVEVYECKGQRGEELVLRARLEAGEAQGLGVTLLPTDVTFF